MDEAIKKEVRDVDLQANRQMKINYISLGINDKEYFDRLLDLGCMYEGNINNRGV
mgnify:FL=1|jgi:hypothetical protein